MRSWDALPDVLLGPAGQVTEEFIKMRMRDYRGAARYLSRLPFGRNSSRTDALAVLRESCGTCSTKHALLKLLAMEQQIEIALVVGIYEMSEHNTPGSGACLQSIRLRACRRRIATCATTGIRIDVTRALAEAPAEPIEHFYTSRRSLRRRSGNIKCTSPGLYPSMAGSATHGRGVRLPRDLADPRAMCRRAERVTAAGVFR